MSRLGLIPALLLTLLCASVSMAPQPTSAAEKPNFVFFLVDDFGWGDLGCYGSTFHETPNIDRLAAGGMRFTNAYAACTVCSPSRAAIITGRYPGRLHLTDWIAGHGRKNPKLLIPDWNMRVEHELTTLPEALGEAGYRSAFVGKWHLMPIGADDFDDHYPERHGFDRNIGGREWGQPKGPGKYFAPFGMPGIPDGEKGDYLTDNLTDEAIDFIGEAAGDPFLLYFSYYTVHGPIMARPDLLEKYQAKAEGFENPNDERVHPAYAGMVESLDQSVGRVVAKLEEDGLTGDTIIIFTADNGGDSDKSSGGLRGRKALSYEGGTRVAAIAKWPGKIPAGSASDAPVIGTDFYPTMLAMADLPQRPDAHMDGINLLPVLSGDAAETGRDSLYWHYPHYHRTPPYGAIRQGDLKLIEFFEDGKLELYDLAADPAESADLATSQPEKAKRLQAALQTWREEVGAQLPVPNPDYGSAPANAPVTSKLGKISASSSQAGNAPAKGADGSEGTRWAADGEAVPQWWMVEFPKARKLSSVEITWQNKTWFDHRIEVSTDGKTWRTVAEQKGDRKPTSSSEHTFEAKATHLRVTVDALGSGWVSFKEIRAR